MGFWSGKRSISAFYSALLNFSFIESSEIYLNSALFEGIVLEFKVFRWRSIEFVRILEF